MTWFGIVMFLYYCLNVAASLYYVGKGSGPEYTRGTLIIAMFIYTGFLLGLLFFGTGLGVW